MTTRADVNRLADASKQIVELARADLAAAFAQLDLSKPEATRDALLEIVPALVREYGDMAAVVAAEWYEELRVAQVGGSFTAILAAPIAEAAPVGGVRIAAGHLFTGDPSKALAVLSGSLQRYVMYSGRETVRRNAGRDRANPRYGRIPTGAKTCAFCELMASRGFVYGSKKAAGDNGKGVGDDYHNDCNCAVVVEFDAEAHHIAGYDPDAMYDRYLAARDAAGSGDPSEILAAMRRLYPNDFTDGVHEHAP